MPLPQLLQEPLEFPFPRADVQAGVPLVGPHLGCLLWGEGQSLRITLNRPDFAAGSGPGDRLPMGRLDVDLPDGCSVSGGALHLLTGEAVLALEVYSRSTVRPARLRAAVLMDAPVLCLQGSGLPGSDIQLRSRPPDAAPALELLSRHGIQPGEVFDFGELGGWVAPGEERPTLCVGWLRPPSEGGFQLYVTAVYGQDPSDARRSALRTLETVRSAGFGPATLRSFAGWRRRWNEVLEERGGADGDPRRAELLCADVYRSGGRAPDAPGEPAAESPGEWSLRPDWLDGTAIGGHRREPPKWKPSYLR